MCSRKKMKFMCTASFSVWASRINQECMNITKNLLVSMTCANLACYYIIRSENTPIETGSLKVSKFEVFRGKWAPSVKNQGNVFWKWNSSIVITDNIFNDIYVFFLHFVKISLYFLYIHSFYCASRLHSFVNATCNVNVILSIHLCSFYTVLAGT